MEHLRNIPHMDDILKHPEVAGLMTRVRRGMVVAVAREVLAQMRAQLLAKPQTIPKATLLEEAARHTRSRITTLLQALWEVINGTRWCCTPIWAGSEPTAGNTGAGSRIYNLELDLDSGGGVRAIATWNCWLPLPVLKRLWW